MAEKRYAIVRVDDKCPIIEDLGYCDDALCDDCKFKEKYGDTKKQMIRKVAQALELFMKKGYRTITLEEYAKFIVEFLGVEE